MFFMCPLGVLLKAFTPTYALHRFFLFSNPKGIFSDAAHRCLFRQSMETKGMNDGRKLAY